MQQRNAMRRVWPVGVAILTRPLSAFLGMKREMAPKNLKYIGKFVSVALGK